MSICYFEDYQVGMITTSDAYAVSKKEIVDFAKKWDPQPFHVDETAARNSIFKGITASASHTFSIAGILTHRLKIKPAVLAALGFKDLGFPKPVRPGDNLTFSRECMDLRASRSRPDAGIVSFQDMLINQDKQAVATMKTILLIVKDKKE